jgi:hypothetical protein
MAYLTSPLFRSSLPASGLSVFLVLSLISATGCGSFSADGIDGFTPMSQVWNIESLGTTRSHSLVLTSVAGYCGKRRSAEQDRLDADRRHSERLAAGDPICESTDLWYDDMADAYSSLAKSGARYLQLQLVRAEEPNIDTSSAPATGHFAQFGSGNDGSYIGQIRYFEDAYWQRSADAWACLDPENTDDDEWMAFLNEGEPDLRSIWNLSGGAVDLSEDSADGWAVTVEADLVSEGQDTVGSVTANFTAERCEIEVGEASF